MTAVCGVSCFAPVLRFNYWFDAATNDGALDLGENDRENLLHLNAHGVVGDINLVPTTNPFHGRRPGCL